MENETLSSRKLLHWSLTQFERDKTVQSVSQGTILNNNRYFYLTPFDKKYQRALSNEM